MSLSRLDEFESFPLSDETMVKHSVVSDSIAKLCFPTTWHHCFIFHHYYLVFPVANGPTVALVQKNKKHQHSHH